MNRTLTLALAAAAVVGASGGTVAAVSLTGEQPADGPPVAAATATEPAETSREPGPGSRSSSATPATEDLGGPGDPGDPLWVTRRELHDGDLTVRLDLGGDPASVERTATGWLVTTRTSPQEPAYEAVHVLPDGSVRVLAATYLDGDVSPDGTRYVAATDELADTLVYAVWDVATGEVVDTVEEGAEPTMYAVGGAQFVDDQTLATTWAKEESLLTVLAGPLGETPLTYVSDDFAGRWSISPDGRWFAADSRTARDVEAEVESCAMVAPADGSSEGVVDCGSTFYGGPPSWAPDSSAVLAVPARTDGFGPGQLRAIAPAGDAGPEVLDLPDLSLDGTFLDADTVVVRGAADSYGDGVVISTCELGGGCSEVARQQDGGPAELARTP